MTSTARSEADCKEFFDDAKTLNRKIKKLAKLIRNSKHFCAFTGAGISTAAGIADFRSGINTVLATGTGKWAANSAKQQGKSKLIKKNKKATKSIKAIPTASHMALVSLMTTGPKYLKCMISQNTDGLHRRSGIPVDQLCELHGNTTLEVCDRCGKGYMRDYRCRNSLRKQKVHDHKTGRYCTVPKCGGNLRDTIINFGEDLPVQTLKDAQQNTDQCDVMLALGSSLTVTPAADLPEEVGDRWLEEKESGKTLTNHLVIVNLQKTPLEDVCSLRIFAKIDDVMVPLMKELGLEIPDWKLQRFMKVKVEQVASHADLKAITISAVDVDGITATVFENVEMRANQKPIERLVGYKKSGDEFTFHVPSQMVMASDDEKETESGSKGGGSKGLVAELSFFGNYSEPNLCVPLCPYFQNANASMDDNDKDEPLEFVCRLVMDIGTKQWTVESPFDAKEAELKSSSDGHSVDEVASAMQSMDMVESEENAKKDGGDQ